MASHKAEAGAAGEANGGRGRRPTVVVEAKRRTRERRTRLAGRIRTARLRRGWTQAMLGGKCGFGRQVIGRAERGEGRLDLESLERIAIALDMPLIVDLGREAIVDVRDAGHLAIQELVLRLGRAAGYRVRFELATKSTEPWHSSDVVLEDATRTTLIDVECWNSMDDIGAAARSSTRKQSQLAEQAVASWGHRGRAAVVWVVRATLRNRTLLRRYPEVFATRFPGSSRRWLSALLEGTEAPDEPGLVWSDIGASQLFEWRKG